MIVLASSFSFLAETSLVDYILRCLLFWLLFPCACLHPLQVILAQGALCFPSFWLHSHSMIAFHSVVVISPRKTGRNDQCSFCMVCCLARCGLQSPLVLHVCCMAGWQLDWSSFWFLCCLFTLLCSWPKWWAIADVFCCFLKLLSSLQPLLAVSVRLGCAKGKLNLVSCSVWSLAPQRAAELYNSCAVPLKLPTAL